MSNIIPIGPYMMGVKVETTSGTYIVPDTATDFTWLAEAPTISGGDRDRVDLDETNNMRSDDTYAYYLDRYKDVEVGLKINFRNGKTDGNAAYSALLKSAGFTESSNSYSITQEPATTVTLVLWDRNGGHYEQITGAFVESMSYNFSKDGALVVDFSLKAMRRIIVMAGELDGAITDSDTSFTVTNFKVLDGSNDVSITGLTIPVRIHDGTNLETITVTAYNRATQTVTATRNATAYAFADETPIGGHTFGLDVDYLPEKNDYNVIGPHDWTFTYGGNSYCMRSASVAVETGLKFVELESCAAYSTKMVAGKIKVSGELTYIANNSSNILRELADLKTEELDGVITGGSVANNIITITLSNMQLGEPTVTMSHGDVEERKLSYKCKASYNSIDNIVIAHS